MMTIGADPSIQSSNSAFDPRKRERRKSLAASSAGNILEWYEWSAYAAFAPFIAAAMFNSDDAVSALLSTLAVFAVGFLMRPLGGWVFGIVADRRGRKVVLITTMLMMAGGSLAIALLPTYGQIGVWASALLLLIRMLQGFAHGGESAAANTYIAELAPARRRGMWSSLVWIAIYGGSVLAFFVSASVTSILTPDQVNDWGWRIPFFLGVAGAFIALYLRRGMMESEHFEAKDETEATAPSQKPGATPAPKLNRGTIAKAIFIVIAMTSGLTVVHYTWTSYVSTYAISERGMNPSSAFWATTAAQIIALVALPLWGRLSDVIGRKPMLIAFAVVAGVLQVPLMTMISDQPWTLFVSSTVLLLAVTAPGSMLAAVMAEMFPTRVRTQGIGFAYSISVAVFGGSAPYLNQLAIDLEREVLMHGYIILLCVFSGVCGLIIRETKGAPLSDE